MKSIPLFALVACASAFFAVACNSPAFRFEPRPPSYDLHCGDEVCPTDGYACTRSLPERCEFVGADADAAKRKARK